MRVYSAEAIDALTRHCLKDTSGFNWLMNNGYRELIAVLDAVRDDKVAFRYLMDNKHVELAAFVNAIWEDGNAFKFLMDRKAFDWAAAANIINGDGQAQEVLTRTGKLHFVRMAHAIQSRIHEDGDRNMSPMGVLQNLFNFRDALKKAKKDK